MIRLLAILYIILVLTSSLAAQVKCDHVSDSLARIESMRLALGKVTYFDGKRIEVVFINKFESRTYTFDADENSVLELTKDFNKTDLFWIVYCDHNHALTGDREVYYPYVLTKARNVIKK